MRPVLRSMVLVSLLAVSSQVHADDAAIRKLLAANYVKIDQAFRKNDAAAFSNMLTSDYTAIETDGTKMNHAEMIANFKRECAALRQPEMQSVLQNLSGKDNQVVATVHERLSGTMSDPHNQPHKFLVIAVSQDTWVKKEGVWKIKLYKVLSQTMTMDGKPLKIRNVTHEPGKEPDKTGKEPDKTGKEPDKTPGKVGAGPDKGGN